LGSFLVAQLAYYFIFSKSGKTQNLKRLTYLSCFGNNIEMESNN
jgi:hypothetical protein